MSSRTVSIIIPVHNKWELTAACLESLARHTAQPVEVIVVDNASTDLTNAACPVLGRELFPTDFNYLRLETNRNFAPACNIGAKAARGDLLFFLNNDTLVTDNWLPPLLAALEAPPYPTAVGPLLLYPRFAGRADRVQHLGLAFEPQFYPSHIYEGFPAGHPVCGKRRRHQALTGAALLLPRQVFFEHKGFDERFINGGEDVALGLNLTAQQHILTVVPESRVYHLASQTPGIHDHAEHNAALLKETSLGLICPDLHFFAEADGYALALTPGLRVFLDLPKRRKEILRKQVDRAETIQALEELTEREPLCHDAYPKLASLQIRAGDMRAACDTLFLALKLCPQPELARSLIPVAKAAGDEAMQAQAVMLLNWYAQLHFSSACESAAWMRQFMQECGFANLEGLYASWLADAEHARKYYQETQQAPDAALQEKLRILVDEKFDYAAYPNVRASGLSTADHYVQYGFNAGRTPNAWFKKNSELRQFSGQTSSGEQPLLRKGGAPARLEESPVLLQRHDGLRQELKDTVLSPSACKVVAWYLPQFYPIGENDLAWGSGFTEWSNVAAAMPRFDGHVQPHLPGALGFYDLRRKETLEEQIRLARHAGIHGFCLHHYWFSGKKILRTPLEHFRADPALDFPFCLHWANEPWTKRWDGSSGDVIIPQQHSFDDSMLFIKDIAWALADPRYMRFQGKPMLGLYRPALFADIGAVIQGWRAWCRDNGLGEICIFTTQAFKNSQDQAARDGFDAIAEYPPHMRGVLRSDHAYSGGDPRYAGSICSYAASRDLYLERGCAANSFPVFRGVMTGWDNSARSESGRIFEGATAEEYGEWLERTLRLAENDDYPGEKYVFLNAWNEWAESAYLEPDARCGFALLNTTAKILDSGPALPHLLFVCDPEDLEPGARLAEILRANLAEPAYRPVVYVPSPMHSIGTFQGLAPLVTSFGGLEAQKRLAVFGYFSFAACVLLGTGARAADLRGLSDTMILVGDGTLAKQVGKKSKVWRAEPTGAHLPQWVARDMRGGRAVLCADLLRESSAQEAERLDISIIVLPAQAEPLKLLNILHRLRFHSSFRYEILVVESLAAVFSDGLAAPVVGIESAVKAGAEADNDAAYLKQALSRARGKAVWFLSPEDTPRPGLPEALLPCFVEEDIVCARSYEKEEQDALPHIFTKHTYRLKGSSLMELAWDRDRDILVAPACALFRRAALLQALKDAPKGTEESLPDIAARVYARGDVALVPASLLSTNI